MIKINRNTGDVTHDYTPEQIETLQNTVVENGAKRFFEKEEEKENV